MTKRVETIEAIELLLGALKVADERQFGLLLPVLLTLVGELEECS